MCLNHAEISVVVAEDQEQVDKILSLGDRLPDLKLVIYDDPRGMRHYATPFLKSFDEIQNVGARLRRYPPRLSRGRDR